MGSGQVGILITGALRMSRSQRDQFKITVCAWKYPHPLATGFYIMHGAQNFEEKSSLLDISGMLLGFIDYARILYL